MKQLYCDIDSTINNHWERIKKWAVPQYPGNAIHPKAFSRAEIMKDEVLPGAREALDRFSEEYDITFLTARKFDQAYDITKSWLDQKGFRYTKIIVVDSSKAKIPVLVNALHLSGVDLFIDDFSAGQEFGPSYVNLYSEVISELRDWGIPLEVFKNNWGELVEKYLS